MNWTDRNVFVTGATGIVGSWLVKRLLERGARVIALVRDWDPQTELVRSGDILRTNVVNGRLEDYDTLERAINEHEIDTVFHLGAQTIVGTAARSPISTFESNIQGTWNLLEACRQNARLVQRVVVASSDKAYGVHEELPYTERHALQGTHPYDVSKSCADLIALAYHHTYATPVCVTRCGNLFGGGDLNFNRLVPGTVRSALRGERPLIRSDGTMVRDYVAVQDVVDAYLLLAERMDDREVVGRAFNFATGEPQSVLELTRRILRAAAREDLEPVILNEAKGEIPRQYLSSDRAREVLGWRPSQPLDARLREAVEWYRAWLAEPR